MAIYLTFTDTEHSFRPIARQRGFIAMAASSREGSEAATETSASLETDPWTIERGLSGDFLASETSSAQGVVGENVFGCHRSLHGVQSDDKEQRNNPPKRLIPSSSVEQRLKEAEAKFRIHRKTVEKEVETCHMLEAGEPRTLVVRDR